MFSAASATACEPCPAGTFNPVEASPLGPATCQPCAAPEWSDAGAVECWPGVVSATAFNPLPLVPGHSLGDVVAIVFTKPTNRVAVAPVTFVPSIGELAFSWRGDGSVLEVRVEGVAGVDPTTVDVGLRLVTVVCRNVSSASGLSRPSRSPPVVVLGTWGEPTPPVIVNATAYDTGLQPGFGTNDSLRVCFDQTVEGRPVDTPAAVDSLLSFSPPLSAYNATLVGTWQVCVPKRRLRCPARTEGWWWLVGVGGGGEGALFVRTTECHVAAWVVFPVQDRMCLTLTATVGSVPGAAGQAWVGPAVGAWLVAVRPSADFRSFNRESHPSNATAVVAAGTWGMAPTALLLDSSASSVRVTLSVPPPPPPAAGPPMTVAYYLVQWSTTPAFSDLPLPATWSQALATAQGLRGVGVPPTTLPVDGVADTPNEPVLEVRLVAAPAPLCSCGMAVLVPPRDWPGAAAVQFELEGLQAGRDVYVRALVTGPLSVAVDALGAAVLSTPPFLAPLLPEVRSVTVPGGTLPGGGGVTMTVEGQRLGLRGRDAVSLSLTNGPLTFQSEDCSVAVDLVRVLCTSPPGAGKGFTAALLVSGAVSTVAPGAEFVFDYAIPVITQLLPLGDATQGGFAVRVLGKNFGPVALHAVTQVFCKPSGLALTIPVDCDVVVDDVELACTVGEGVGGQLQWTVVVANQSSVAARTSYLPPVLSGIAVGVAGSPTLLNSSGAMHSVPTAGGVPLVLFGDHFGPAEPWLVTRVVGRSRGAQIEVAATGCALAVPFVQLVCVFPPGGGRDFVWSVVVANVESNVAPLTTSYGPPAVRSVAVLDAGTRVLVAPTAGGVPVVITGDNFSWDTSAVQLMWNGARVAPAVTATPHTTIVFAVPAGDAASVVMALSVFGQGADDPASLSALATLSYAPPRVDFLAVRQEEGVSPIDCGRIGTNGVGGGGVGTATAVLEVWGASFGLGPSTNVSVGGERCDVVSVGHSTIVCETRHCVGTWCGHVVSFVGSWG
jgi:hypothetical protein